MSGNKANVAKSLCHTKLVTPVSNRGHLISLKYFFSNFVFMRYAWLIRCYNALKFITLVWSVLEIFTFTFRWGVFFLTSIYNNFAYFVTIMTWKLRGRGILTFSYIRRLGLFFGFSEKWIFWGMKFVWTFLVSSQNWTSFRGHIYHLRAFLKVKVQNGNYKYNIFGAGLIFVWD